MEVIINSGHTLTVIPALLYENPFEQSCPCRLREMPSPLLTYKFYDEIMPEVKFSAVCLYAFVNHRP